MPFCKYCYSSQLPRRIYTNHNTFITIQGEKQIECKNLAKTKCRKCKQYGHSSKYCSEFIHIQSLQIQNQNQSQIQTQSEYLFYVHDYKHGLYFILLVCFSLMLYTFILPVPNSYQIIDEMNDPL